jgi:anti-sigma regulatory factor (Ser/Thr protein kinase)
VPVIEIGRWELADGDACGAMNARRAFRALVRGLAISPSDVDGAELIFGELAANGVEHGAGRMTLVLGHAGGELVLSIHVDGDWIYPVQSADVPTPSQARGRGLFFVRSIARRIEASSDRLTHIVLPVTLPA